MSYIIMKGWLKLKRLYQIFMAICIYAALISTAGAEINLLDVHIEKLQDRINIVFVGDAAITDYDSVTLTEPPAIVIDIPKTICTPKEISVSSE
ncbi:AMIN domain-containing protein [Candidatus Desantisbacteria bacterium]|nr:AMIN domain-containing protein [Candidatus Desantisbacteria bacterium]